MIENFYITNKMKKAINELIRNTNTKTSYEIEKYISNMYKTFDDFCKRMITEEIVGNDCIIYTLERQIGKSETLFKLADEYKIPFLVGETYRRKNLEEEAKRRGYEDINFISFMQTYDMKSRTIIKDEILPIKYVRSKIPKYINVIGIEEVRL